MTKTPCPICKGSALSVKTLGIKCPICNGNGEVTRHVGPGSMTPAIAESYLREWMGLKAVKMTHRTEEAIFFTASNERFAHTRFAQGSKREYMVLTFVDSEEQYDVHSRPIGGSDLDWEWVDAITKNPEQAIEDEKSWEGINNGDS